MKKCIKASYINEDEGRSFLDSDIKSLQQISYDIENLIEYNKVYQNSQSNKLLKELISARRSVTSALEHLFYAAEILGD